jgi:DNA-binding MarR family transcriptional regulator
MLNGNSGLGNLYKKAFNICVDIIFFLIIIVPKMNNSLQNHLFKPSERMRDLQFLEEIQQNPRVSQRELSNKFGIALGVTNACIKRMARRGLIRLKGFPPRRIAYYLTPKGFAEKAKLTLHFFSYNIQHYAEMKKVISRRLVEMQEDGIRRIAFYGVSDEMEITYITLHGSEMKLVGIIDENEMEKGTKLFGHKVMGLKEVKNLKLDAILVTSMREQARSIETLTKQAGLDSIRVLTI